jgi:hypothetical protein
VVAVDAVDPDVEHLVEHALELAVPGQRVDLEPVEQRDMPSVPLGVMEIDGVDRRNVESTSLATGDSSRQDATVRQS